MLTKFKSKDGDITPYAPGRLLIITDTATQVRRLIRIVEEVDQGGAGDQLWFEPVHYGSAQDVAAKLNEIAQAAEAGADLMLLPEAMDLGWTHPSARAQAQPTGRVTVRGPRVPKSRDANRQA